MAVPVVLPSASAAVVAAPGGAAAADGGTGESLPSFFFATGFLASTVGGAVGAGRDASNDAISRLRSSSLGVAFACGGGGGGAPIPDPPAALPVTNTSIACCTSYDVVSSAILACLAVNPIPSTRRSLSTLSPAVIAADLPPDATDIPPPPPEAVVPPPLPALVFTVAAASAALRSASLASRSLRCSSCCF